MGESPGHLSTDERLSPIFAKGLWTNPRNICQIRTSQALAFSLSHKLRSQSLIHLSTWWSPRLKHSTDQWSIEPTEPSDHGVRINITCHISRFESLKAVVPRPLPFFPQASLRIYISRSILHSNTAVSQPWVSVLIYDALQRSLIHSSKYEAVPI